MAQLEGEIDTEGLPFIESEAGADGLFEACLLYSNTIGASIEEGCGVVSIGVGDDLAANAGLCINDGDFGSGDDCAGGIGDSAGDLGGLGEECGRPAGQHYEDEQLLHG